MRGDNHCIDLEFRAGEYFKRLGYKINAVHIAEGVTKEWDSEQLWNQLIEQEIEERKDFQCEKCRNYQKKSIFNNKAYCEDCKRKDLYEPKRRNRNE